MLQVFKFFSGSDSLSNCSYFKVLANSQVRGNCKKLVKCFSKLDNKKFIF